MVEPEIIRAEYFTEKLVGLLGGNQFETKTQRDVLCLLHWALIVEHQRGIILLLRHSVCAPAFALIRPITEAFLRLHIVMLGTDKQVESIRNGTYQTEFETVGEMVDKSVGMNPLFGPILQKITKPLHGFTHGGVEQLTRLKDGNNIAPNYSNSDARDCLKLTTLFPFIATMATADFLNQKIEFEAAEALFDEYLKVSLTG